MSDNLNTPPAETNAEPNTDPTPNNTPPAEPNAEPTPNNIFSGANAPAVTYDFTETCNTLGVEFSQEASEEYISLCKDCGINNEHANKLAAYGLKLQKEAANSVIEAQIAREQDWANQFKQAVGKDYDATLQKIGIAKEWAEKLFPGFTQMASDTGAGNHPVFLNMMAKLSDLVGEENGNRLNGAATGQSSIYDKTDFSKY